MLETYQLTAAEYDAILALQGGRCYICGRKPWRKRLSVDHNHHLPCSGPGGHDPKKGCKLCIRGLLCNRCNKFLGHIADRAECGMLITDYLTNPPAGRVLNLGGQHDRERLHADPAGAGDL